jgi:hypothetical protein
VRLPHPALGVLITFVGIILTLFLGLSCAYCQTAETVVEPKTDTGAPWKPLKGHWETCSFGGDGPVTIADDKITLEIGDPLTGVRWTKPFPKDNFELRLQARRTEGFDFFCAVTFPIGDGQCSLVLGGWGGGLVGISSIDGNDASSNETTQFKEFKNGQWYDIRIRVTKERLQCFIDDDDWVDFEREDHDFDIRLEMDPALPLGLANYQCGSEMRRIETRLIKPKDDE